MSGQFALAGRDWRALEPGSALGPPRPVLLRALSVPARHYFPEHSHPWNQLVYAISGVLIVAAEGGCFIVPPEQAVWLPHGVAHSVGSLLGAEFRSLYVTADPSPDVADACTVIAVSPLLRALVIEAADLQEKARGEDRAYASRVVDLILDQLRRAPSTPSALPWPRRGPLVRLCEALYADPADQRSLDQWSAELGMSGRTLARRFEAEMGLSVRAWRRRLRSFKAIEMLSGPLSVTEIALELGYASTSAFIYMFRRDAGISPQAHRRALQARR
jgi:AraC-like DNA-binding protein